MKRVRDNDGEKKPLKKRVISSDSDLLATSIQNHDYPCDNVDDRLQENQIHNSEVNENNNQSRSIFDSILQSTDPIAQSICESNSASTSSLGQSVNSENNSPIVSSTISSTVSSSATSNASSGATSNAFSSAYPSVTPSVSSSVSPNVSSSATSPHRVPSDRDSFMTSISNFEDLLPRISTNHFNRNAEEDANQHDTSSTQSILSSTETFIPMWRFFSNPLRDSTQIEGVPPISISNPIQSAAYRRFTFRFGDSMNLIPPDHSPDHLQEEQSSRANSNHDLSELDMAQDTQDSLGESIPYDEDDDDLNAGPSTYFSPPSHLHEFGEETSDFSGSDTPELSFFQDRNLDFDYHSAPPIIESESTEDKIRNARQMKEYYRCRTNYFREKYTQQNRLKELIKKKIESLESQIHELHTRLANLTTRNGFEQYCSFNIKNVMEDIIRKRDAFQELPIGPVGFYLDVVHRVYGAALECCLRPILSYFIVSCDEDEATLYELLKQHNIENPQIYILEEQDNPRYQEKVSGLTYLEDIVKLNTKSLPIHPDLAKEKILRFLHNHPKISFYNTVIVKTHEDKENIMNNTPPGVFKCCMIDGTCYGLLNGLEKEETCHSPSIWVDDVSSRQKLIEKHQKIMLLIPQWKRELLRYMAANSKLKIKENESNRLYIQELRAVNELRRERERNEMPRGVIRNRTNFGSIPSISIFPTISNPSSSTVEENSGSSTPSTDSSHSLSPFSSLPFLLPPHLSHFSPETPSLDPTPSSQMYMEPSIPSQQSSRGSLSQGLEQPSQSSSDRVSIPVHQDTNRLGQDMFRSRAEPLRQGVESFRQGGESFQQGTESIRQGPESVRQGPEPLLRLNIHFQGPRMIGLQVPLSSIDLGNGEGNDTGERRYSLHQLMQIVLLSSLLLGTRPQGVSQEMIDRSTKKMTLQSLEELPESQKDCPICLNSFAVGEVLREMPCHHFFHSECVDQWLLESSSKCPMCRQSIEDGNEDKKEEVI